MLMMEGRELEPEGTKVLLDTNILVQMVGYNKQVTQDLDDLTAKGYQLCICFQNLTELWCVASRPVSVNGLGVNLEVLLARLQQFRNTFVMLPDRLEVLETWIDLCFKHQIVGLKVHDARLAATALANGVSRIMTRNPKDFKKFEELTILESQEPIKDKSGN